MISVRKDASVRLPATQPPSEPQPVPTFGAAGSAFVVAPALNTGPAEWVARHRDVLLDVVDRDGALRIRGLEVNDPGEFARISEILLGTLMNEREGFAPRSAYPGGVRSASHWPADQPMCLHHELSYARECPGLLLYACLEAPAEGGATTLADSRLVTARLPAEIRDEFARSGWLLTRSYNEMLGVSWEEAFGVSTRREAEEYCRANAIDHVWDDAGGLRTRQRRHAFARHPVDGATVWFNQIAFLSRWTMAAEVREYLVGQFGVDGLPFDTARGDGADVDAKTVQTIHACYAEITIREPWRRGDLLLIDNVRMAHGRDPFRGSRHVLVAMGRPIRQPVSGIPPAFVTAGPPADVPNS